MADPRVPHGPPRGNAGEHEPFSLAQTIILAIYRLRRRAISTSDNRPLHSKRIDDGSGIG